MILETLTKLINETGFAYFHEWRNLIMVGISFIFLFLAIVKGFEPLLLVPIAFGMLLSNIPGSPIFDQTLFDEYGNLITENIMDNFLNLGLLQGFYILKPFFPSLIFLGVGAMTDFGPLIANPKSLLLGAAAQFGIFVAFFGAMLSWLFIESGFTAQEAASIGIIGGADGPTAIWLTSKLAPVILGAVAVAAYSYMALVPVIQPPIMKLLTTKQERMIKMDQLRPVSQREKILFPIMVAVVVIVILPPAAPLIGMLMLGNLFKECGSKTLRLSDTAANSLINTVTILLGLAVGASAYGETFLQVKTVMIVILGVIAFGFGTAGGVLLGKLMNAMSGGKINPLIGSAGVSAVPMAARVSQVVGQKENPSNFLLMHAMGPNVAGVIGSAVAAAVMYTMFNEFTIMF